MTQTQTKPGATLYARLGGADAVKKAVDIFYERVLADPLLSPYFEGVDMKKQMLMQRDFLTLALGGPTIYSGKGLRKAHKHLVHERGLDDIHFDAVLGHLGATLTELGVPDHMIEEAAGIVESARDDVLDR